MTLACQVLGHYYSPSCYPYVRDDGVHEWRQRCSRCGLVRTCDPTLKSDASIMADLLYGPDRYSRMWDR